MSETVKILSELGFTPLNIALTVAVIVLWGWSKLKDTKQTESREAWHADTRAQLIEVKKHSEACEEDRKKLSTRVEDLSRRVEDVARCPRKDCPMRQH